MIYVLAITLLGVAFVCFMLAVSIKLFRTDLSHELLVIYLRVVAIGVSLTTSWYLYQASDNLVAGLALFAMFGGLFATTIIVEKWLDRRGLSWQEWRRQRRYPSEL